MPQRAERVLDVVIVGMLADAQAWRDLRPFPSLEEGFEDDLTLHPRQVGPITANDLIELVSRKCTKEERTARTVADESKAASTVLPRQVRTSRHALAGLETGA